MYNPEELQSAKNDLMNGVSLEDLEEMYDVRLALAAVIECAKDLGWDMDEYLQKKQIEETLYLLCLWRNTAQSMAWFRDESGVGLSAGKDLCIKKDC